MRDFGRVKSAFWQSADVQALDGETKLLALYLLTSPHGNLIGCFYLPLAYIAADTGLPAERVPHLMAELEAAGFCRWCSATSWVWIRRYIAHNPFENPNVRKAALKVAAKVPAKVQFFVEFAEAFRNDCSVSDEEAETLPEPFRNCFRSSQEPFRKVGEQVQEPYRNKTPTPTPTPTPKPESSCASASAPAPAHARAEWPLAAACNRTIADCWAQPVPRPLPREVGDIERRWREAGATVALVERIVKARAEMMQANGEGRMPSVKYFTEPILEAAARERAEATAGDREAMQWRARLDGWRSDRTWFANLWGPKPGEPGCRVPAALLVERAA